MGTCQWDPELETGDDLVDRQHRNIHALFGYLESAEDSIDEIMRVLDRLMDHVDCHFATEEQLMERTGYPRDLAEPHIEEHRRLTDGARRIVLQFHSGELVSTAPVVEFLRDWLAGHVHQNDRRLIEYVRKGGVSAQLPQEWADRAPTLDGTAV